MEKVFTLFEFSSSESTILSLINAAILIYFMVMTFLIYRNMKK